MVSKLSTSFLFAEFKRDQSLIAAAYAEYLAETDGVRYSELEATKALAFYLTNDQVRYEQILEKLRSRMQEMRRDGRVMSISLEA